MREALRYAVLVAAAWTFLVIAAVLPGCSRTGLCGAADDPACTPCVDNDECSIGVCVGGRCLAPGEAVVPPELDFLPEPIDFGRVPLGERGTETFTIRNVGAADALIDDVLVLGSQEFTLVNRPSPPLQLGPGSQIQVDVAFEPDEVGVAEAMLLIRSNDGERPSAQIPMLANASVPCLALDPQDGVDFGTRRVGREYDQQILLTNCGEPDGSPDVVVDGARIVDEGDFVSSDAFSLPDEITPLVLAPEESVPLLVRYSPREFGEDRGLLRIHSDDPARDPVDLELRGLASDNDCPEARMRCTIDGDPTSGSRANATPLSTLSCVSDSRDVDGFVTALAWTVVERPRGSTSQLLPTSEAPEVELFLDLAGRYVLRLDVEDDRGAPACNPAEFRVDVRPDEDIHVQLVWDTPGDPDPTDSGFGEGTDVDLHLLHPNGGWTDIRWDCHFRNTNPEWGEPGPGDDPSLDIDDTDGAGPENINLNNPENDTTYRIGVHYWIDNNFGPSYATVRIFVGGDLLWEAAGRELPMTDAFWDVATLRWPEAEVVPIDSISTSIP